MPARLVTFTFRVCPAGIGPPASCWPSIVAPPSAAARVSMRRAGTIEVNWAPAGKYPTTSTITGVVPDSVLDGDLAVGADLDDHHVGDHLAGREVDVGHVRGGDALGVHGEEAARAGPDDGDVEGHGPDAAGGDATPTDHGDVTRQAGKDGALAGLEAVDGAASARRRARVGQAPPARSSGTRGSG